MKFYFITLFVMKGREGKERGLKEKEGLKPEGEGMQHTYFYYLENI